MRFSIIAPVIAFTVIGGLTPVFGKLAVNELPWMSFAWMRFGTAGVLLAVTARLLGKRLPLTGRNLAAFVGLGALCVPINQAGFLLGLKLAGASHAGIFYALNPILVFAGALLLGQARFRADILIASLLAIGGAVAVTLSANPSSTSPVGGSMVPGDLLLLLAVASWSAFSVLSRPLIRRYGAIETLCTVFLLGALLHTPLALRDIARFDPSAVTARGWIGAAYLTLVTSYINYMLWYWVIARHDITRVAVVTNCHFLVTVSVSTVVLHEPVGALFAIGCVLMLCGVMLATRPAARRRPQPAHPVPRCP